MRQEVAWESFLYMRRKYPSTSADAIPAPAAESELDLAALGRALWARKGRF